MTLATRYPAVDPSASTLAPPEHRPQLLGGGGQPASPAGSPARSGWELAIGILQVVLFVALAGSLAATAGQLSAAPERSADPTVRVRSDLVLMLLQCGGGLIVMFLPGIVRRRFAVAVPNLLRVGLQLFLFASIYLGEVCSFYYRFPVWDGILHFVSGAMLATLGLFLARGHARTDHRTALNRRFVALFAFCFAAAGGAVWEIYEFAIDGLFATNMQKVVTDTGQLLIGGDALADTMSDLVLGAAAAAMVAIRAARR